MALAFSFHSSLRFLKAANGSAGAPSYSFASSPIDGMWLNGAGALSFSASGINNFVVRNGNIDILGNNLRFGSGSDTTVSRISAKVVAVGAGGDATGQVNAAKFTTTGTGTYSGVTLATGESIGIASGATLTFTSPVVTAPAGTTIIHNCAHMHTTCTVLSAVNAGSTATLTNAPVAGNPHKWVIVNDGSCTFAVPMWKY